MDAFVIDLAELTHDDGARVGGKNASLGEMVANLKDAGVRVPEGFATTAAAYWHFIDRAGLRQPLADQLAELADDRSNLAEIGQAVRTQITEADMPGDLRQAIVEAWRALTERTGAEAVAVRSSATAEDLPGASFAGQLETWLNVRGEDGVVDAVQNCFASLFTDRAIAYRLENGFDHMKVALSAGVQRMIRADQAASGVMFSLDTESGFEDVVLINAAWGLGETVVQGVVNPDEYHVWKPGLDRDGLVPVIEKTLGAKQVRMVYDQSGSTETVETDEADRDRFVLDDEDILTLARWAVAIERHYDRPMDMEWARDGADGPLFIVQARPETVQSRRGGMLRRWRLTGDPDPPLVEGLAIGESIACGPVVRRDAPGAVEDFPDGGVLVTPRTDPDWVPIMKKASAIVTDQGGRTSHAAIVSREMGLSAVVGTGNGTERLADGATVTVSCAQGDAGRVFDGAVDHEVIETDPATVPDTATDIMVNMANPAAAYRWWRLPVDGVGLARLEFIIGNRIKVHPMALLHPEKLDPTESEAVAGLTRAFARPEDYFIETLARGIARIAAVWYPRPAIVRLSDFKTNEYAGLIGGGHFEPDEANPMIGWRGAARYDSDEYREGFALECQAIRRAREVLGLDNIVVMVPFCRTLAEADRVLGALAAQGLIRGRNGLKVFVMAEIPSNVLQVEAFADRFDGFSIGTNDLTQLVLGIDRDNSRLAGDFDARDPAVGVAIARLLEGARAKGVKTGLCGQAPSDHPAFARFLVRHGIGSISVSPDSFAAVKDHVLAAEQERPGP